MRRPPASLPMASETCVLPEKKPMRSEQEEATGSDVLVAVPVVVGVAVAVLVAVGLGVLVGVGGGAS